MKTLYKTIDKEYIKDLPKVIFKDKIIVVDTLDKVEEYVDYLLLHDIIGIDTETSPSFKKGVSHEVALVQISTENICFLFRLNKTGMPPALIRLFEDTHTLKIGLSLDNDFRAINKRVECQFNNFIDLQSYVKPFGIQDMSLQKIFAILFNQKISKRQRLSNWEASSLSYKQQNYAAIDAWACVEIYEELNPLKENNEFKLEEKLAIYV